MPSSFHWRDINGRHMWENCSQDMTITSVKCVTNEYVWAGRWQVVNQYIWWRHQMETFSALLVLCAGNSPVTGEFPTQRPVTRSFAVSLIFVWINAWVNSREAGDLRRHCAHYNVIVMNVKSKTYCNHVLARDWDIQHISFDCYFGHLYFTIKKAAPLWWNCK